MKIIFVYLFVINLSLNFANSQIQDCLIPETANNGTWQLNGTEISPGTRVKENTTIRTICNPNFELIYGNREVITKCVEGQWSEPDTFHEPICLELFNNSQCAYGTIRGCLLPTHPANGKWVHEETGEELRPGTCVGKNVSASLSCNNNYNYFGERKAYRKCTTYDFHVTECSDKNSSGYVATEDCIVFKPALNTKWIAAESDDEILTGAYVKNGTIIRSSCLPNFSHRTGVYMVETKYACVEGEWRFFDLTGKYQYPVLWTNVARDQCQEIYIEQMNNGAGCEIPEPPDNSLWLTWDTKTPLTPGKYVTDGINMIQKCKNQTKRLSVTNVTKCSHGIWENINYFGVCELLCEPLYSTDQFKVICTVDNKISENCTEPLDGTVAETACKATYQNLRIWESKSKIRVCLRGKWNNNVLPNCIPKTKCGLKAPNLRPLIVNGTDVSSGGYPWHVALYKIKNEKRKYYCGGSLISDRLIITAAHCVTYQSGIPLPVETLEVSVGKQFSNYSDSRDKLSQSSTIIKIFIPDTYKGDLKNFMGDIAILVAQKAFNLHDTVLPVCVNFAIDKLEQNLLANHKKTGYVPGFGVTGSGSISETLKEIGVPLIRHENCSKYLSEEFIEYYSYDKFCAGFLNQSTSVCSGDSGGGLVVQNTVDNRFYLAGIVSVTPLDTVGPLECNIQQYTLFTNVAEYVDFILEKGGEYLKTSRRSQAARDIFQNDLRSLLKTFPRYGPPVLVFTPESIKNTKHYPGIPYLATIGTKIENETHWFCAGNLISDRFILTAASCASNRSSSVIVRLGIDTAEVKDFQVVKSYVSPDYYPLQVYSDIAVMKLGEKVNFSNFIHPLTLDARKNLIGTQGVGAYLLKNGGSREDVTLESQSRETCDSYFKRYSGDDLSEGFVDDVQYCVKNERYGTVRNFCDVLPGSPITMSRWDYEMKVINIWIVAISTRVKDCTKVDGVMLFTKVGPFVPWIEGIVWPEH